MAASTESCGDADLEAIFKIYPGIFEVQCDKKKVLCKLTKHELLYSVGAVDSYIKGKKFQRLYQKVKSPETVCDKIDDKYKDFFVPSKKGKSRVYCILTKKEINNLPHEIEKHVSGYRFLKAKFKRNGEEEGVSKNIETVDVTEDVSMDVDEDHDAKNSDTEIDIPDFVYSSEEDEHHDDSEETGNDDEEKIEEKSIDNDIDIEKTIVSVDVKAKTNTAGTKNSPSEKMTGKGKKRKVSGKDKKIVKRVKPKKMQKV